MALTGPGQNGKQPSMATAYRKMSGRVRCLCGEGRGEGKRGEALWQTWVTHHRGRSGG